MEQDIIDLIRNGENQVIDDIYLKFRQPFVKWASWKYQIEEDNAMEIFQYAVVIFYDNIVSGKIDSLGCTIKTYLFAIGKNKIREQLRQNARSHPMAGSEILDKLISEENYLDHKEAYDYFEIVRKAMQQLGNPCGQILEYYYYYSMSMLEITKKMEYKNTDTAKNMKYKCLKRLQRICNRILNTESVKVELFRKNQVQS